MGLTEVRRTNLGNGIVFTSESNVLSAKGVERRVWVGGGHTPVHLMKRSFAQEDDQFASLALAGTLVHIQVAEATAGRSKPSIEATQRLPSFPPQEQRVALGHGCKPAPRRGSGKARNL